MSISAKAIYRFNARTQMVFFIKITKNILKLIGNHERARVANVILSKKNEAADIISNFKAVVTKTKTYWHKN